MNTPVKRPIVALGLLTFKEGKPGQVEVQVVSFRDERVDPVVLARAYVERGVSIVAALSKAIEPEELAAYVPGVSRNPHVEWIAAVQDGAMS